MEAQAQPYSSCNSLRNYACMLRPYKSSNEILLPFLQPFLECFLPLLRVVNNLDCIYISVKRKGLDAFEAIRRLCMGIYKEGSQKG